jgi:flagellin-like protein
MKSITPVISVILMVLITIVASVSAFFFINSNVSDLQSQGNLDTNPVMDNSRLNLVSITGSKAIVRNDGTSPVTEVVMFVNGELLNYTLDTPILPGQLKEIDYIAQIAGEDLEIKIIYNAGKTTTFVSPANKNIESSGFVISNEPDYSLINCLNNDSSNVWFNNVLIGNNSACCGDDGTLDDFYNSTSYCCNGNFDLGTCHCGDCTCQSWENVINCDFDCNSLKVNSINIVNFNEGLFGYCNATSTQSNDLLRYNFSWNKNGIELFSNLKFKEGTINGGRHICGVLTNGSAMCWGYNSYGILGNGLTTDSSIPVFVSGGYNFLKISTGSTHTCGVLTNGNAMCWGRYVYGQLGDGTLDTSYIPVFVFGDYNFSTISTGLSYTCGLLTNGSAMCWGYGGNGQLGNGSTNNSNIPIFVFGGYNFTTISTGSQHTCGILTNGSAMCWGYNTEGQLGNGSTGGLSNIPVFVSGNYKFYQLSSGNSYSCGVLTNGSGVCWGYSGYGQLGNNGIYSHYNSPVFVNGNHNFSIILAGATHTCGVLTNGSGMCWGDNDDGQLGNGSIGGRSKIPIHMIGTYNFSIISVGAESGMDNSCGVLTNSSLICWGTNYEGQLGNGSIGGAGAASGIPVFVSGNYNFINNSYYWNKNTLISILPSNYYSPSDEIIFTCNILNHNLTSSVKNITLTI